MAAILSDKFGARTVMYWTFGFALVLLFMLSYPPTDYVIQGKDGPITFSTQMGVWPFVITLFVLGFFMSLGKAAVFKHIPVYYPQPRRRGRRPCRHDRRPWRLRPADRLRRPARSDRHLHQLLCAAVRCWSPLR